MNARRPAGPDRTSADVHSDTGYFAIVPEWLLDATIEGEGDDEPKAISGNAIKLYAILARYADQATSYTHPSRMTLAKRMGFSRAASVDPIIQQLVAVGAVEVFERFDDAGDRTSNGYIVKRIAPNRSAEVVRESAPPPTADRSGGSSAAADDGGTPERTTVVRETAQEPEPSDLEPSDPEGGASAPAPRPTCAQHPTGTAAKCRPCGDARRIYDAWQREQAAAADNAQAARRAPRYDMTVLCEHLQRRDSDCDACSREARQALEAHLGGAA